MKTLLFLLVVLLSAACFRKKKQVEEFVPTCGTENPIASPKSFENSPAVFKVYCATCHSYDQHLTGPALKGMVDRVPDEHWLRVYLTNFDSLAKSGDSTFKVWEKYSPVRCTFKKGLNPQQVAELINYMKE